MAELFFINPVLRRGVNVTVRDGYKWDNAITSLPTDVSILETGTSAYCGRAFVVGKMVTTAEKVPAEVLALEHDPACTTPGGLYAAMRRAYGPDWTPDRVVTVLFFTPVGPEVP